MKNYLILPDIPEEIIELYVAYNESKNEIIDREYSEISVPDKQMMHTIYCNVIGEIDDSLEAFRQEKFPLLIKTGFFCRNALKNGNDSILDWSTDEFKNHCANMLDTNLYVLYAFVFSFVNDGSNRIPHRGNFEKLKEVFRGKYFLEIEKGIGRMGVFSIKKKALEFDLKLLKVLADYY